MTNQEEARKHHAKIKQVAADSNVSAAELKEMRETFAMIDLDESNKISLSELKFALDLADMVIKESHLEIALRTVIPGFTGNIAFAGVQQTKI